MENKISGVIYNEKQPIIFTIDKEDYICEFYTENIYQYIKNNTILKCYSKNNFLYGKTHDNHNIAIYYNYDELEIYNRATLYTSCYIISEGYDITNKFQPNKFDEYNAICFKGKILNELFNKEIEFFSNKNGQSIKYNGDIRRYIIKTENDKFELIIKTCINERHSIKGIKVSNDIELILKFNNKIKINDLFYHYNKIKELLCFMVYRENISFEEVSLLNINNEFYEKIATVHIKEKTCEINKSFHGKINFDDVHDILPNILNILYHKKDDKYSYNFGFLPKNDEDVDFIDNTKIKNITSGLECELNQYNYNEEDSLELNELIKITKKNVEEYRKTHNKIDERTYNLIFSNIDNWDFPLYYKLIYCYHEYEEEMNLLKYNLLSCSNFSISNECITDDDISNFVKYRNSITHGKHRIMDMRIYYTAYILSGLIYCLFLSRMGMDRNKIRELCKCKLLR